MVSPASEYPPTSEVSDATTAETTSAVRPVSDPLPYQHHHQPQQQQQQAIVIVEQPPTPPTSLPLLDNQSAPRIRSADRMSPRQPAATATSDSLPPVAEEDIIVADDNITGPITDIDEVFPPPAGTVEDELETKSQTGLNN